MAERARREIQQEIERVSEEISMLFRFHAESTRLPQSTLNRIYRDIGEALRRFEIVPYRWPGPTYPFTGELRRYLMSPWRLQVKEVGANIPLSPLAAAVDDAFPLGRSLLDLVVGYVDNSSIPTSRAAPGDVKYSVQSFVDQYGWGILGQLHDKALKEFTAAEMELQDLLKQYNLGLPFDFIEDKDLPEDVLQASKDVQLAAKKAAVILFLKNEAYRLYQNDLHRLLRRREALYQRKATIGHKLSRFMYSSPGSALELFEFDQKAEEHFLADAQRRAEKLARVKRLMREAEQRQRLLHPKKRRPLTDSLVQQYNLSHRRQRKPDAAAVLMALHRNLISATRGARYDSSVIS